MKATNKYERFFKHVKKKVRLTTHAFRMSAFIGRASGQKVILTSIPKSGTNLIYQLLYHIPYYRFYTGRGLRPWMFISESDFRKKIISVKKGQIMPGHIPAFNNILETVENEDIKILFMIRDPRDVLLSHLKYVTNIDRTHSTHDFFKDLMDDDERIEALLYGVDGVVESIPKVYSRYRNWKNCKTAITVRFENLIGIKGGGKKNDQLIQIKEIVDHLNVDLSDSEIEDLGKKVFNTDSDTFRSGKIQQWRNAYTPQQLDLVREELGDILIDYGYEEDENW